MRIGSKFSKQVAFVEVGKGYFQSGVEVVPSGYVAGPFGNINFLFLVEQVSVSRMCRLYPGRGRIYHMYVGLRVKGRGIRVVWNLGVRCVEMLKVRTLWWMMEKVVKISRWWGIALKCRVGFMS